MRSTTRGFVPTRPRSRVASGRVQTFGTLLGLVVFTAACSTPTASTASTTDLDVDIPRHECADAGEPCEGTVTVPMDWDEPDGEEIEVAFRLIPRADQSEPAQGTVLANPGGPSPSIPMADMFQENFDKALQHQDLLLIDMRGVGESAPLECEGLSMEAPETAAECGEELGEKAGLFTMDQAVHDHEAVRAALGIDQLTLWGNSYGTMVAQSYATNYPGHTRAVYLDGSLRITESGYGATLGESQIPTAMKALDSVCARSPQCDDRPGAASDRVAEAVEQLRAEDDPEMPAGALSSIVASVEQPVVGREVNAAISSYLDGNDAPLRRLYEENDASEEGAAEDDVMPAQLSYICGGGSFPFDPAADTQTRLDQLDSFYDEEEPYAPFTAQELLSAVGGDRFQLCAQWPASETAAPVDPDSYPDVPTVMVNGTLDTTTPPSWGADVAEKFPDSTHVTVPFGTHDATLSPAGPCVPELSRRFLTAPHEPVEDPGCDASSYISYGGFPEASGELPDADGQGLSDAEARTISLALGAADDAAIRRHQHDPTILALEGSTGVYGGEITFDDQAEVITLDEARFTTDTQVSGEVTVTGDDGTGHAYLRISGDEGDNEVEISWPLYEADEVTDVSGTVNGGEFTAGVSSW